MNEQAAAIPSLSRRDASVARESAPGENYRHRGPVAVIRRIAARLGRRLVEIRARIERERLAREAIEHLESMSDAQLRDVGIQRADIVAAVRFGRHYYVDRDTQ